MPEALNVQIRGWDDKASARRLGNNVIGCVKELGRMIDVFTLDGITIAGDYHQALADLDRGYKTNHVLTASNDMAIGVAMTPSVIRDGRLKSLIVINGHFASGMFDVKHELFRTSIHRGLIRAQARSDRKSVV